LVNNETGALLPIDEIVGLRNRLSPGTAIYLDAVQALGKIPVKLHSLGIDMCSFSAHKVHGLKGIGLLYVKNGVKIEPLIYGGGQQDNMRSGTVSVMNACVMSKALEECCDCAAHEETASEINSYLREELVKRGRQDSVAR